MSARAAAIRWLLPFALVLTLLPIGPGGAQEENALGFPPTLELSDPGVLKGQTHKAILHYQVLYDQPVEATFDVVPRTPQAGDAWIDASAWVRLDPSGKRTVTPSDDYPVEVQVVVPGTAANGEYRAGIRIRVTPSEGPEGSGAGVEQSGTTILILKVTGDEVKRIESKGTPTVRDAEPVGKWTLLVPLSNTGNVRANPHIKVEVWDQMRTRIVKTLWHNQTFLDPGESSEYPVDFQGLGLPVGQYWAVVEVFMDGVSVAVHRPATFDIVEEGTLKRLLGLRTIRVAEGQAWVDQGELVSVAAMVRNVGELPVDGVFKLKVERDGKLLDAVDSDPLEIPVGEERAIEILYKVDQAGKYAFIGHVRYGTKVTDEKTTYLNVQGEEEEGGMWVWLTGGVVVAALAGAGVMIGIRRRGAAASSVMKHRPRAPGRSPPPVRKARPPAPHAGPKRVAAPGPQARPRSRPPDQPRRKGQA